MKILQLDLRRRNWIPSSLVLMGISLTALFPSESYSDWLRIQPKSGEVIWIYDYTQKSEVKEVLTPNSEKRAKSMRVFGPSKDDQVLNMSLEEVEVESFQTNPTVSGDSLLELSLETLFSSKLSQSHEKTVFLSYALDRFKTQDLFLSAQLNPEFSKEILTGFLSKISLEMISKFPQVGFQAAKTSKLLSLLQPQNRFWEEISSSLKYRWQSGHFPQIICSSYSTTCLSKDPTRFPIYIERYLDVTEETSEFKHLDLDFKEQIALFQRLILEYPRLKAPRLELLNIYRAQRLDSELVKEFEEYCRVFSPDMPSYHFLEYLRTLKTTEQEQKIPDAVRKMFSFHDLHYYSAQEMIKFLKAENMDTLVSEAVEKWMDLTKARVPVRDSDDYWTAYQIAMEGAGENHLIRFLNLELAMLNSSQAKLRQPILEVLSYAYGRLGDRVEQRLALDALIALLGEDLNEESKLRRQRFQILKAMTFGIEKNNSQASAVIQPILKEFRDSFEVIFQKKLPQESKKLSRADQLKALSELSQYEGPQEDEVDPEKLAAEERYRMRRGRQISTDHLPKIDLESNWKLLSNPALRSILESNSEWIELEAKVKAHFLFSFMPRYRQVPLPVLGFKH